MKDNQHNIFQVPIWGFILNEHKYQSADYIECLDRIKDTEPTARKSNFGGYQTRDNLNETEPVLKEWISAVENIGNNILKEYNASKVRMTELWGNINDKYCYNGAHVHGGILSGVFYLKTPPNSGNLVFVNPAVRSDGHLLRDKNFTVQPEPLALIIFPSWLEHYVESNLSDQRRISLSFNLGV